MNLAMIFRALYKSEWWSYLFSFICSSIRALSSYLAYMVLFSNGWSEYAARVWDEKGILIISEYLFLLDQYLTRMCSPLKDQLSFSLAHRILSNRLI